MIWRKARWYSLTLLFSVARVAPISSSDLVIRELKYSFKFKYYNLYGTLTTIYLPTSKLLLSCFTKQASFLLHNMLVQIIVFTLWPTMIYLELLFMHFVLLLLPCVLSMSKMAWRVSINKCKHKYHNTCFFLQYRVLSVSSRAGNEPPHISQ